jgi:hypothetical protein
VNCGSPFSTNGGNSSEGNGSGNRGSRKRGYSEDSSSNDTGGNKRGRHISYAPASSSSTGQTDMQNCFDGYRNNLPNEDDDVFSVDENGNLIDPDSCQDHEQRKRSTSEERLLREFSVSCITHYLLIKNFILF